jgi:hypothetical protein
MNNFYKYSLEDHIQSLPAKSPDYVIKLSKGPNTQEFKHCIFFAIDGNMDTYSAHDSLAITYYPRSCHNFDLQHYKLEDNRGNELNYCCKTTLQSVPRCWPSFGQQGGAREVILVDDSQHAIKPLPQFNHLQDGGETDEFHQDNTAIYDLEIAKLIAESIISALRSNEVTFEDSKNSDRGSTIGSIRPQSGLTISGKISTKFISISSGLIVYGSSIRIKLWASLWMDNNNIKQRYIYGPLERELTFSLFDCNIPISGGSHQVKEFFKLLIQHKVYPYLELNDVIKDLIRKATMITDGFFNSKARCYPLP